MGFTSLAHLIDIDWLHAGLPAHPQGRRRPGVDGQTGEDYEANLKDNLQSLLDRAKSGTYRAPPVRRVHIPKAGSTTETRPIGIPTLEDKVLQRAVVMVLEPIYEQDFLDCSYGFRPGRSAHQALESLVAADDGDGRGLDRGSGHSKVLRHAGSCPSAGVPQATGTRRGAAATDRQMAQCGRLEDGCVTHPETGSPQGGVISPLLANVYLHYVLDEWFAHEVQPRLRGRSYLIRYADDCAPGNVCSRWG